MHTRRPPTPEAAALEKRSRGPGDALVALMVAVMRVTTAAWVCALVVLAGWLISRIL
jgi:uncharacterized RDD family membrane protein YckC